MDLALGLAELLLFPTLLVLLAIAVIAAKRTLAFAAAAAALLFGVTLAFPLGMTSELLERKEGERLSRSVDPEQLRLGERFVHEVAGVPLASYSFHLRRIGDSFDFTNYTAPGASGSGGDLRMRYYTWPLATGAVSVSPTLTSAPTDNLRDPWRLRFGKLDGDHLLWGRAGSLSNIGDGGRRYYRISYGVASDSGVLFWILAAPLAAAALVRAQRRSRA